LRRAAGRAATRSPGSSPAGAGRRRGPLGSARLVRRAEFDAVYRNGRRRTSRQFTVFFAPNGLTETRFGMSVGRTLGGAVVRNRIRRRVREILRLSRREIPAGWDIVVHPRASVASAEFFTLRGELVGLLGNSISGASVPSCGEHSGRGRDAADEKPGSGSPPVKP